MSKSLLKQGAALLLDALIEEDDLSLRLDGLVRIAGRSSLGEFHYIPVLFHESEKPAKEQRALLEIVGLLLGCMQGRQPSWGSLVHGRDCITRHIRLGNSVKQARRTLQAIRETRTASTPPRLLLNAHCQACEFRQRCHADAAAKDDLSLLRSMSEIEITKLNRRGIFTVTQLSCTFRPPRRTRRPNAVKLLHNHALRALSIREKKIHFLGTPELVTAPVRIFFDLEGDPERGFDYLLGLLVVTGSGEERHSFWADTPAAEPRLFEQFLDVLQRFEDFRLYAYGSYEAAFLRRMNQLPNQVELGKKALDRLVNVLAAIRVHVYFPTYSNSLKDIAGYLGFQWSAPDASGLQSIVWRRRWEQTGQPGYKERLTTYNQEDCAALRLVTEHLEALRLGQSTSNERPALSIAGFPVSRVEDMDPGSERPSWKEMTFLLPDFAFANERAHFDYQRDRVYLHTSGKRPCPKKPSQRKRWKKGRRVNREVEISCQSCPFCGGTALTRRPNGALARLAFDLRISRAGIRPRTTRFRTAWHHCVACARRFLPNEYLQLKEFCHSLQSWAMHQYVAYRISMPNIADSIREYFKMPIYTNQVHTFKESLAEYYRQTYEQLIKKIVAGKLVHGDETEVHVRNVGKAYVWIFTNLEHVVYVYRPNREGEFLHDFMKGFNGVFVSDFYAAYDSLPCQQQKCLVHLMRDFNQDIRSNPWDEELKSIAADFGSLLRAIVATVDIFGLKRRHFGKHRRAADRFFRTVSAKSCRSVIAEGYQKRLLKCREKLFTFLDHDGIPWNNNNAEHAVKGFAHYREVADNLITERGLKDYLVLLSIHQTCKYMNISFLRFLLSRETDVDKLRTGTEAGKFAEIECYPTGLTLHRPSRKRLNVPAPVAER